MLKTAKQAGQSQESKLCRMFNARSETVHEKSVFGRLLSGKRCIVLLNGFYEWAQVESVSLSMPVASHRSALHNIPGMLHCAPWRPIAFPLYLTGIVGSCSLCNPVVLSPSKVSSFQVGAVTARDGVQEHKIKQPYYIHYADERIMAMAGLYDNWKDAEGNWLTTFTILTTDSSKRLEWCVTAHLS